jgi:hypothetical protein
MLAIPFALGRSQPMNLGGESPSKASRRPLPSLTFNHGVESPSASALTQSYPCRTMTFLIAAALHDGRWLATFGRWLANFVLDVFWPLLRGTGLF